MLKCGDCGKFMRLTNGASSADIYDMVGMGLDHERYRCSLCTERLGPVQSNARPHDGDMAPYQMVKAGTMSNEPFGRQPRPVTVNFYGEKEDVEFWKRELARHAEFKGDRVQQSGF